MADVRRLLSESRLVTLTGVGGVGKSRLALQVARASERAFPDGAWFIGLADVTDGSLVSRTVAMRLDLRYLPETDPQVALVEHLADKRALVVLDNCEHVLDACAILVRALVLAAPGIRVLATSRAPLGIGEEQVWPVSPLTLPDDSGAVDAGSARRSEAPMLFEERAAAVSPGFAIDEENADAVIRLCRQLDGLPLAIELAAVRTRVLSVEQILSRLNDPFRLLTRGDRGASPRHHTLRAAVDWSYSLCSAQEQELWARLSVFAGHFDLDAAESVCSGEGLGVDEVFTGVERLLDQSILTRVHDPRGDSGPARYRMLQTIRQYGQERLTEQEHLFVELRRRLRDYYLRMAEKSYEECFGPEQRVWFERLRVERANVWAALDFCLTQPGEARAGLQMAGALCLAWVAGGSYPEGLYWVERALSASAHSSMGVERARSVWAMAYLMIAHGDMERVSFIASELRELARSSRDGNAREYATHVLESVDSLFGTGRETAGRAAQPLPGEGASGPEVVFALLERFAFAVALMASDESLGDAATMLEDCRARCEAADEDWQRSWSLRLLAMVRWRQGDSRKALALLTESTEIAQTFTDPLGSAWDMEVMSWVLAEADADTAARLGGASEALWRRLGTFLLGAPHLLVWHEQCRETARKTLGSRLYEARLEAGTRLSPHEARGLILGRKTAGTTGGAVSGVPREPSLTSSLTRREREVSAKVAKGMSNREIASALVISQRTAETHVENILRKLGFTSRTQIALWISEGNGG